MIIDYEKIPDDLEEMIEEGEFVHGNFSKEFENAMFFRELMERGSLRRSHRIITDKCKNLGTEKTIELLTGKTMEEIYKQIDKEIHDEQIKQLFELAEFHGYILTKKNISKNL